MNKYLFFFGIFMIIASVVLAVIAFIVREKVAFIVNCINTSTWIILSSMLYTKWNDGIQK